MVWPIANCWDCAFGNIMHLRNSFKTHLLAATQKDGFAAAFNQRK
ncbi:hypothetical protein HMPREF0530_1484 [Lacticaseibacillus paracasei subsp. paracasei ATCC 25302 = DSM 5622 = JCM 8130]|uniref:Uncharacterized protein n=1 Tax=Lacticaseibacillus paracasei subsp. paracasei TaxID=47714 RepID=A0AAP9HIX2_LACPA|nr:hypothetical protein HMPREF0530_1484 [Lacticaseibacillus paracasei subsp. paracasei ATCC 25302 = DSM 5622 = JCM 8130]QGV18609.1 Hypothetical protein LCAKO_2101 [Lacticaseibacillus paracasei subsp. paracasei]